MKGFYKLVGVIALVVVIGLGSVGCNLTDEDEGESVKDYDYYENNDGSITILGYKGEGGAVTIPANIKGKPVTIIGYDAFVDCDSLTSVIIPNSVTTIESWAFAACDSLTSVTIGSGVTTIRSFTFNQCTCLTSVTFIGTIPAGDGISSGFCYDAFGGTIAGSLGDLRAKFYATDTANGTPGTYTTTAPVNGGSLWMKQ